MAIRALTLLATITVLANVTVLPGCAGGSTKDSATKAGAASSGAANTKALPDRDPRLAKKLVADGAVLIDVRTQEEWDDGHVDGASHIPVQQFQQRLGEVDKLAGGDKSKPVVLYCRSGGRAGRAKSMLLKAGHTQVTNMGGFKDWPKE